MQPHSNFPRYHQYDSLVPVWCVNTIVDNTRRVFVADLAKIRAM